MQQFGGGVKNFYEMSLSGLGTTRIKVKDLFNEIKLSELNNKIIAVDASNVLYEIIAIVHKLNKIELYDMILRNKLKSWENNNITSIWIFDNPKPNPLRLQKTIDICKPKKNIELTASNIRRAQEILKEENIKYIVSKYGFEAEQICAKLTRQSLTINNIELPQADLVMTCDSDALIFGAKGILMKTNKPKTFKSLILSDILKQSKLNRKQLAIAAVMLGTDFNKGTKGVGYITVVKLIKSKRYYLNERQNKIIRYYLS